MRQIKSQIKIMFTIFLVFTLFISQVYAVSTVLESPTDNFIDDDGFLDLRASCTPTTFDGTTSYNITNAILYSDADGTWKAEQTQQVENPTANSTYLFNFTNVLSGLAEGQLKWNVWCHEANSTNDGTPINKEFAVNNTIKVQYAKPTITTTSPADGVSDIDGYEIDVVCTAAPSSGWNITSISLITDLSGIWAINQTNIIAKPTQDAEIIAGFTINKFGNNSIADGTSVLFSCSATQVKGNLEDGPISEKSSPNRTLNIDYSLQQCVDGACDLDGKRWCKDKVWIGGTESQYCLHCSYADKSCPVCEDNACDRDNQKWCNGGNWSVINYCMQCGDVDAYCAGTCENGVCDSKNKKWCNNNVWDGSNYCMQCGDVDSTCFFECLNGICDIKNKKWCNQGSWEQTDYYSHCNNKDFYYGASCQTSICDIVYNRWCDSGSWKSLNYCDNCEDSDCLGTCLNNACDVNAKKWCNNGLWTNADYCDNCGTRDSSCSVACQENICDTTANKYCFSGTWNDTDYCDNCALKDSDCTITCAEGECDTTNKRVCINGEWNNTTENVYCSFCSSKDATCGVECLAIADGCCLNASDDICDIDCAISLDPDCDNCTSAQGDCCFPKNDTICDLDCAAGSDYDCTDAGCKDSGTCKIGSDCTTNLQCASGFCFDNKCMEQCNDNIKDGNETDVDCGGSCGKCANYKKCKLDSDCSSDFCSSGTCLEKDTCNDEILDGDETDVDCGGSCPNKCVEGQNCGDDSDCELGFECILNLCSEKIIKTAPADEKDSDGDGILDKWEIKHGLDLLDPSDAEMDFDEDGLINLQEYTFGTDPNDADTDGDKVSDKKEIEVGTDPLDPVSKPGGIGGLLFFVTILIILFGAGGYGVFYYIHYRNESGVSEPSFAPTYIPRKQYALPRQAPRKDFKKMRVEEIVKKRREEKKRLREKIFGAFDNGVEQKQKTKTKEEVKNKLSLSARKEKIPAKKVQKPDVFSRLEKIYEKEEKKRKKI
jgi:hypothetical protein